MHAPGQCPSPPFLPTSTQTKLTENETISPNEELCRAFDRLQSYGFIVTRGGCIVANNCSFQIQGRDFAHYKVASLFFLGPDLQFLDNRGRMKQSVTTRLCRTNQCMNPLHLLYEPNAKMIQRTSCCFHTIDEECRCGQIPKCLHISEEDRNSIITYQTPNCEQLLKQVLNGWQFELLPRDFYDEKT